MRVLLVAGSFPPEQCGVGDYTEKLATALAALPDTEIGVLTTRSAKTSRIDGVEILNKVIAWKFGELFALIGIIRAWRPDILHIQYPSQGFFYRHMPSVLPLLCRMLGIKVVQTWHEPYRLRGLVDFSLQFVGANGLIFVRKNYLALLPPSIRWLVEKINFSIIANAGSLPLCSLSADQISQRRRELLGGQKRLVVFFGFLYPGKGIELLLNIANPETDRLIIAGAIADQDYQNYLVAIAASKAWANNIEFPGFLSSEDAANLLASADAVVLPFLNGGGDWNTSIHGAQTQGTLVITTSENPFGDKVSENIYTAAPNAIGEMRTALNTLAGRRSAPRSTTTQWHNIAVEHLAFYERIR